MQCDRCRMPAVYYQRYSGRHLCADHLSADIEARAKRVIRQNHWLNRGEQIGVFTGMKSSAPLIVFLENLLKKRSDICIIRLAVPACLTGNDIPLQVLSGIAEDQGVTRIALPDTADDIAVQTLHYLFSDEVDLLLDDDLPGLSLPVMQPFREIPSEELSLFADHYGVSMTGFVYRNSQNITLNKLLNDFASRHPSAPHALRHYRDHLHLLAGED